MTEFTHPIDWSRANGMRSLGIDDLQNGANVALGTVFGNVVGLRSTKPFFAFSASADQHETLRIFDVIGFDGVQDDGFARQLDSVRGTMLNVEINSPGGDVFVGIAIYNMLRQSGKTITVKVMGLAASAASVVAMAGDTIEMSANSFMMVHNASELFGGNAVQLRKKAELLDRIDESMVALYARRTRLAAPDIRTMLANETWLTADEARAKGFATRITDAIKARAAFDIDSAKLPERVKAIFTAAVPTSTSTTDIWNRHNHRKGAK